MDLLEDRRLSVAKSLPVARTLVDELLNFKVEFTAATYETFGAWRHGQRDDLVLAAALACWWAQGCEMASAGNRVAGTRSGLPQIDLNPSV